MKNVTYQNITTLSFDKVYDVWSYTKNYFFEDNPADVYVVIKRDDIISEK